MTKDRTDVPADPEATSEETMLDRIVPGEVTRLDAPGTGAQTRLDRDQRDDRTALDRSSGADDEPYSAVRLPPPLAARFAVVETIRSRGAEADLIVVREMASEETRVIKLYRAAPDEIDRNTLRLIRDAAFEHVVRVYDDGESHGVCWEEMEYCPLGSLADFVVRRCSAGDAMDPQLISDILREVIVALNHLHQLLGEERPFVHRDLKPGNVLVRTEEPLDLVLSDFGLATVLDASRDMRSTSRTVEYAAPEAAFGSVSPARDWWSLGVMVIEFATGSHPFRDDDGNPMEPAVIGQHLATRPMDVSGIADDRLRLLAGGLLVRDPEKRWGRDQVTRWLAGEMPSVAQDRDYAGSFTTSVPFRFTSPSTGRDVAYDDLRALAAAMAIDHDRASAILRGGSNVRREQVALRDTLRHSRLSVDQRATAEELLSGTDSPDRRLLSLLRVLDPAMPPTYRGVSIEYAGLAGLVRDAVGGGERSSEILESIWDEEVLRLGSSFAGCEQLDDLEAAWHEAGEELDRVLTPLADRFTDATHVDVDSVSRAGRALLLLALLDRDGGAEVDRLSADALEDTDARRHEGWLAHASRQMGLAETVAAVVLRPAARLEGAALRRAEEAKRKQELERRRARRMALARSALIRGLFVGAVVFGSASVAVYLLSLRPGVLGGAGVVIEIVQAAAWAAAWSGVSAVTTLLVTDMFLSRSTRIPPMADLSAKWLALPVVAGLAGTVAMNPAGADVMPLERWPIVGGFVGLALALGTVGRLVCARSGSLLIPIGIVLVLGLASIGSATLVASSQLNQAQEDWVADSQALAAASSETCSPIPFRRGNGYRAVARGELRCSFESASVRVTWLKTQAALDSFRASRDIKLSENGECRNGRTGTGTWSRTVDPDEILGDYACYFGAGRPRMDFDFDEVPVYVSITRRYVSLARIWKTFKRFTVRAEGL